MSWLGSGQNDQNIRYWLFDSSNGSYETKRANIESISPNYTIDDGAEADTKVVRGYATDAQIASYQLDIGGAVIDRVHNFVNPLADEIDINTNSWGDKYPVWGPFLKQPRAIPTTPIDELVQWWKDGVKTAMYVAETGQGTEDGQSFPNAKGLHNVDTSACDIIVLCGRLARTLAVDVSGLVVKSGTTGDRTQVMAHPVEGCILTGGPILGTGVGTDGAYVNDSGNRWYTQNTSGAGGNAPFGSGFVMYWNGTEWVPLTKVADAATVFSTSFSFHYEASDAEDPGTAGSRAWVNLGGLDPTGIVAWGNFAIGGVSIGIADKVEFDVYGLKTLMCAWIGTGAGTAERFAWYANDFGYYNGPVFGNQNTTYDEGTGDFNPVFPQNRLFQGNKWQFLYVGIYDNCTGHVKVPIDTYCYDNYCVDHNLLEEDAFGQDLFSEADAHSFTNQGIDGWYVDNNVFERCGGQTITTYTQPRNYVDVPPGLEATDMYVIGYEHGVTSFQNSSGQWICPSRARNIEITWNRIINPRVTGGYAIADGNAISINGDSGQLYGNNGAYDNILIEYNRVEGAFNDGCIRTKFAYPDGNTNYPVIRFNTIRCDGGIAFRAFDGGNNVTLANLRFEPSFSFTDNDVQSTNRFVSNNNVLVPDHHIQIFDRNKYFGSGIWQHGSGSDYATFALWKAAQPTGDTYDPNSTYSASLTTDTGSPTLTISGTGTATASFGADPDGAISSLQYQWRVDGVLIAGAEATTFDYSAYPDGAELDCIGEGVDALGKWFIVTSNTITIANNIGRSGMFGHRYFGARYFGPRYFGPALEAAAAEDVVSDLVFNLKRPLAFSLVGGRMGR